MDSKLKALEQENQSSKNKKLGQIQTRLVQTKIFDGTVICFVDGVSAGSSGISCYFPGYPSLNQSNFICPISLSRTKTQLKTVEFIQFTDKDIATLEAIHQALTSGIENKIKSILIHTSSIKCTTHLNNLELTSNQSTVMQNAAFVRLTKNCVT